MERAVKAADSVLMICTEPYVRKANDGKGGVGYEAMIVTGELVRDLGTRKFMPVIRQGGEGTVVPDCVGTRLWVNFSKDEDFDGALGELIKTLHQAQQLAKPALGPNPFAGLSPPGDDPMHGRWPRKKAGIGDRRWRSRLPTGRIDRSAGDTATWRKLLRSLQIRGAADLTAWRSADDSSPLSRKKILFLSSTTRPKAWPFSCRLCLPCRGGGIRKGRICRPTRMDRRSDQTVGWDRGGSTYWGDFPNSCSLSGRL